MFGLCYVYVMFMLCYVMLCYVKLCWLYLLRYCVYCVVVVYIDSRRLTTYPNYDFSTLRHAVRLKNDYNISTQYNITSADLRPSQLTTGQGRNQSRS